MKFRLLISLMLLLAVAAFAPAADNSIAWSTTRPLTWKDFTVRNTVPASEPAKAWTACNIGFNWHTSGSQLIINAANVFDKNKSWVKKGSQSDYLLAHEQGHFDITEINCRNFKKALTEYTFKRATVQKDVDALFNKYYAACRKEQELYDAETQHSIKTAEQEKWLERIKNELKAGEAYVDNDLTLPIK